MSSFFIKFIEVSGVQDNFAKSIAIKNPISVIISAANFAYGGMVCRMGLFGITNCKINSPLIMLPVASRFKGLMIDKLFSLIIIMGLRRG